MCVCVCVRVCKDVCVRVCVGVRVGMCEYERMYKHLNKGVHEHLKECPPPSLVIMQYVMCSAHTIDWEIFALKIIRALNFCTCIKNISLLNSSAM